jgi:phosphomannomutase
MEGEDNNLIQIDNPDPLKERVAKKAKELGIEEEDIVIVMWEESGGHTINILHLESQNDAYEFSSQFPLIADKYPVPALILITELISRGYIISESIDWSIVGINKTLPAKDEKKVNIMTSFEENDGKTITIAEKEYHITALSDNTGEIDIYRLKSEDSTLYFRPSGTGPYVRFYIFGDRETYSHEIDAVINYVKNKYK